VARRAGRDFPFFSCGFLWFHARRRGGRYTDVVPRRAVKVRRKRKRLFPWFCPDHEITVIFRDFRRSENPASCATLAGRRMAVSGRDGAALFSQGAVRATPSAALGLPTGPGMAAWAATV